MQKSENVHFLSTTKMKVITQTYIIFKMVPENKCWYTTNKRWFSHNIVAKVNFKVKATNMNFEMTTCVHFH